MLNIEILGPLVAWFLILLIKRVIVNKGDLEWLFFIALLTAFLLVDIFEVLSFDMTLLKQLLYGFFGLSLFLFSPAYLQRKKRKEDKLKALKKEYKAMVTSSESLRNRFIALIELSKEGLIFRTDDGSMFMTDVMLGFIDKTDNEMDQTAYEDAIHKDDITNYQHTFNKLSKKKNSYEVTYRFLSNHKSVWIKERGQIIFYEGHSMVIASAKIIDVKKYPESEVELLNSLKIDAQILEALQALNQKREPYYLVFFELANIPAMNAKYGRDLGDLMMGEFLHKLRYNFVKDDQTLFRLTGIRFAMIIKDERKYQILERALKHGGELLNFEMAFGGVKQSVYPYFGLLKVTMYDEPVDDILARTHKALDIAMREDNQENYFIIG